MRRPDLRVVLHLWAGLACLATASAQPAPPAGPFELKDGDRVVLLGGTFIEREQTYGYIETRLTARFPGRNITFRNLGWSGDTVRGEARARFGPPAEGFAHLKAHVEALKPTVIFVNYGLNESFDGKAGLPAFEKDLNALLDVLDKTGGRVVLIAPRPIEDLGRPLPDPRAANARLLDYTKVLAMAARRRGYGFVDLFQTPAIDMRSRLTDNGLHLNAAGYRQVSFLALLLTGLAEEPARVGLSFDGRQAVATGARLDDLKATPDVLSFHLTLDRLSGPPLPDDSPTDQDQTDRPTIAISVDGPGTYLLKIDGQQHRSIDLDRPATILVDDGPDARQLNQLREAIVAKNELYFHRWRPQNETYLFGFRKHEQGNNAREIPLFDPLVAAKEAEIAKLRVPVPHIYEIIRK